MDSSWCSLISIESLVVPNTPMGLPGLDSGPVPKRARMSESKQENAVPLETASVYKEQAALQAKAQPQPGTVVVQPPKRLPPEAETDRRMYVPDLDQAITHRDVFNFFSSFGDLERVCVKNGTDNLNYAMVLFCRTHSMQQAIKSNPHLIKGHRLNCRKAKEKSTNKGSQQISVSLNKPKSTITPLLKAPVMQAQKDDSKRGAGHQTLEKKSNSPGYRSLLLQKLVEPNTIKLVIASNADRNYAYAVTTQDGVSRWSFSLSQTIPSSDEMRALEKGLSRSAKLLLSMRKKLTAVSCKSPKPEAPKCPQSSNVVPKDDFKGSPEPSEPSAPSAPSAPPAPPASEAMLPSLPLLLTITPQVPLPKSVIPEMAKPDLRSVVLSSLGQNYVHHCYTNVAAYRRTKNYIDLLPCERIKRPSIRKYVDQMYARKI